MLSLSLIRHASHGLLDRVLAGRSPGVGLSDVGRREADALARHLAGRGIVRVLASPLERTRETAAVLAAQFGCDVEVADEINEIDCGDWTGAAFSVLAADPRWQSWNVARAEAGTPNGETMRAVQSRAMSLVERLAAADEMSVALVTHSDVIKAIVCAVLGLSLDRHDAFTIEPASVTTLRFWGEVGRVVRTNEVPAP